ncbi:hypothetical protein VTJ04DRAFT_2660 [Mycothermus thermophilus]|uniref:uncharacterized protein n=1 Tax=Humicola insolens TaxID=85995 RepID=UPI003743A08F
MYIVRTYLKCSRARRAKVDEHNTCLCVHRPSIRRPPISPYLLHTPSSWQEIKSQQKNRKNRQQKTATYVLPDPSQLLPTSIPVCVPVQSSTKPSESPNPSIHPSTKLCLLGNPTNHPPPSIHPSSQPVTNLLLFPFVPVPCPHVPAVFCRGTNRKNNEENGQDNERNIEKQETSINKTTPFPFSVASIYTALMSMSNDNNKQETGKAKKEVATLPPRPDITPEPNREEEMEGRDGDNGGDDRT